MMLSSATHLSSKLFHVLSAIAIFHLLASIMANHKNLSVKMKPNHHIDETSEQVNHSLFQNVSLVWTESRKQATANCSLTAKGEATFTQVIREIFETQESNPDSKVHFQYVFTGEMMDGVVRSTGNLSFKTYSEPLTEKHEDDFETCSFSRAARLLDHIIASKSNTVFQIFSRIVAGVDKVLDGAIASNDSSPAATPIHVTTNSVEFDAPDLLQTHINSTSCNNVSTAALTHQNGFSSPYRLRTPLDPHSSAPDSPFSDWFPDPLDDTSDCVDEWGHTWTFDTPRTRCCTARLWRDEFGNVSPKGIRGLGSTENPIVAANGTHWLFNRLDKLFTSPEVSQVTSQNHYPGSDLMLSTQSIPSTPVNCSCHPPIAAQSAPPLRRELTDQWGNTWLYSARDQLYHDAQGHVAYKSPSALAPAADRLGSYENPIVEVAERLVWLFNEERGVFHLRNDHFRVVKCYPGWVTQCCQ